MVPEKILGGSEANGRTWFAQQKHSFLIGLVVSGRNNQKNRESKKLEEWNGRRGKLGDLVRHVEIEFIPS